MSGVAAIDGGSLVDQAIRAVRGYIRDRDLTVGDTLPGEGAFAAELGVSRAVMREAFGALAALRQIDVGNGRKARVAAIDGSVMASSIDHAVATAQIATSDVWDVRRTLELRTAALAAEKRSDADARAIIDHAAAMQAQASDLDALIRHDIAFHQTIARASGNPLFTQIVRSFEPLMRTAVPAAWDTRRTDDQRSAILQLHRDIAQSVADRDAAAAQDAMDRHFDASISDLFSL
ncbi:GntR family transcriptional regulator [Sphingomonas sp. Leaf33]|uniref:FadR/GntR family transcriptional regulator n=1 Tax=Sphingomonas sp. Leaf33 TaxID=1736215 RepID=UPI0006FBB803|nr:FCD domain-containing protein [Sphingomonas sp. Leaf33]KQN25088.1 GntR family transcriptional regulator [Sphingomonas sp. Leaf33]